MSEEKPGELVDYYGVWAPSRFRTRAGKPLTKRTLAEKAYKFKLPIIQTGRGALIDPVQGDDALREHALHRRGRR